MVSWNWVASSEEQEWIGVTSMTDLEERRVILVLSFRSRLGVNADML